VEVEMIHADGQTDMTKLVVAFFSFENASETCDTCSICTVFMGFTPHIKISIAVL
jgi:hypothetical protein